MPKRIFQSSGGGKKGYGGFPVSQFIQLSDAPHSYAGAAAMYVTVKAGENGLEFTPLPPLAITDTYVVNSQAAMLALPAQQGDVAIRTDINQSFILTASPPTVLANWAMLLVSPTHALGGALHTADTIANLKTKLSDGSLITTKPAEIQGITIKTDPALSDLVLIEDTAAAYAKKSATIQSLLSKYWIDPVLSVYDNTLSLPYPASVGDRYIAKVTANGWIKDYIYQCAGP